MQAQHLSGANVGDRVCRKAAGIRRYSDPDVFHIEDIDLLQSKPDQMLVKVHEAHAYSATERAVGKIVITLPRFLTS
jgi:hypothetical protein